jgi:hypothetical protein
MKTARFTVMALSFTMFAMVIVLPTGAVTPDEVRAHIESVIAAMKARQAGLVTNPYSSSASVDILGSGPMDAGPPDYPSNALYLSIAITNGQAILTLHGTYAGFWQLWSTTDLRRPLAPGQIIEDTDGTNQITFDPMPTTINQQMFFQAAGSPTVLSITTIQDAIETNYATGEGCQVGMFTVQENPSVETNLTIYYRTSGSAANGIDYTNMPGSLMIPLHDNGELDIQPIDDFCIDFDETVTITLTFANGQVVDTNHASATILLRDNLTNVFVPVLTNLNQPSGIDYHAPSNSLIVSFNYNVAGSLAPNFLRIFSSNSATATNTVVNTWSGVGLLPEEVKLTTVKRTTNGFTAGDVYFSSNTNIGKIWADGSQSNLAWCTLTNAAVTNALTIRGSLHWDETGVWSSDLIAVTSDSANRDDLKDVWRVSADGHPTLVARILTLHLEGVITIPNDVARWGPWAGKILAGDELLDVIYAIGTDGVVETYDTTGFFPGGIQPEDFDMIQTNQSLYACDQELGQIVKLSESLLKCHAGRLMITQAGEFNPGAKLFIVSWSGTNFMTQSISYTNSLGNLGHFEHVTFAPIDLPTLAP